MDIGFDNEMRDVAAINEQFIRKQNDVRIVGGFPRGKVSPCDKRFDSISGPGSYLNSLSENQLY